MPQLRARITEVKPKLNRDGDPTGWFAVTTSGTPKTLETSQEDLIEEARQWRDNGLLVEIDYDEKESSTINQHTGKPFVNRYYNGATAAKESDDEVAAQNGRREYGWKTDPDDAWRICLSVGLERAVDLARIEGKVPETEQLWTRAKGLATLLFTTPKPGAAKGEAPAASVAFGEAPSGAQTVAPYIDEDWPPRE
jgi:hypothetical protein